MRSGRGVDRKWRPRSQHFLKAFAAEVIVVDRLLIQGRCLAMTSGGQGVVGEHPPSKGLSGITDYNVLRVVSGEQDAWAENVAKLKQLVADNKRITEEMKQSIAEIDMQLVRARKLLKKNPK